MGAGGSHLGWRILKVFEDSPCGGHGLIAYFDFITHVDGVELSSSESSVYSLIVENRATRLTIVHWPNQSVREITVTPHKNWGQKQSLLGLMIRYDSWESSALEAIHLLEIHPGSPAEAAHLYAYDDYLLGTSNLAFKGYEQLDWFLDKYNEKPCEVFVFNGHTQRLRAVTITPKKAWGGNGSLGADVGVGYLHKLPIDQTKAVKMEDGTSTYRIVTKSERQAIEAAAANSPHPHTLTSNPPPPSEHTTASSSSPHSHSHQHTEACSHGHAHDSHEHETSDHGHSHAHREHEEHHEVHSHLDPRQQHHQQTQSYPPPSQPVPASSSSALTNDAMTQQAHMHEQLPQFQSHQHEFDQYHYDEHGHSHDAYDEYGHSHSHEEAHHGHSHGHSHHHEQHELSFPSNPPNMSTISPQNAPYNYAATSTQPTVNFAQFVQHQAVAPSNPNVAGKSPSGGVNLQ